MSEPAMRVRGQILVHNPTARALEVLLSRLVAESGEHPPARSPN